MEDLQLHYNVTPYKQIGNHSRKLAVDFDCAGLAGAPVLFHRLGAPGLLGHSSRHS